MPRKPAALLKGGPATSFSPNGARYGAKIAKATSSRVIARPTVNRFCRSALRNVDGSAGAIAGGGGADFGAHDEIAVLARGVNRMDSRSAIRFTTT